MFSKELFIENENISINIANSSATLSGTIIDCTDEYLLISTKWVKKYYIDLEKISGFWYEKDQ
jgi:hypothetical protein